MDVGRLAVTFLENQAVYADGNTAAATGLDVAKSLSVAVSAGRVVQYATDPLDRSSLVPGDETVTVSVEHSDDNSTWVEADSNEFTEDGTAILTVDSPKAYVRIAWDVAGTSPQPILNAHAVASGKTQDQIGSTDGGSQPERGAYFGAGVFIGNGFGAFLTWDTLDFGTELLDRAAPDQPVVLASGLYALNATYASDAPITANGFVQPTVATGPVTIVGSPASIVHFGVEMTVLLLITAGDALTFFLQNHEGADGSTFNLSNTTLIKIT